MSNSRFRGGRMRASSLMSAVVVAPQAAPGAKRAWSLNWRSIGLALCGLVLMVFVGLMPMFLSACLSSRNVPISDRQGNPLYVGDDGHATNQPRDARGNERERATVPVSDGVTEQAVDVARGFGGVLPGPGGLIVDGLATLFLAGGGITLALQRRKRLEELGLTEEMISIADSNEDTRKKLTNHPSEKVQRRVALARSKRK